MFFLEGNVGMSTIILTVVKYNKSLSEVKKNFLSELTRDKQISRMHCLKNIHVSRDVGKDCCLERFIILS